jgi:DNA replication and repair protein RecF
MFLKSIKLTNFRNYSALDFSFETPITVLVGDNAQGKSNFLEAVYFLATAKSTRAERDEELIKSGEEVLRVEGEVENAELKMQKPELTNLEIAMQLQEGRLTKRVKVNGIARRVVDYSQNLAAIYFAPEDINLVRGSPSLRRDHIDSVLSQVDKEYKRTLGKYEDVLIRKNRVLKVVRDEDVPIDQLFFWLDQQINLGEIITRKRRDFFEFLNTAEKKFGEFEYQYIESPVTKERLNEYQSREIDSASSLIGPHRDDFRFQLGERVKAMPAGRQGEGESEGRDLAKYGSRGEQRTAVLDLKITEMDFMEDALGDRPILLLDDIFSELDHDHAEHVIKLAALQQTIITAVELDEHIKDKLGKAKIYRVKNGEIS